MSSACRLHPFDRRPARRRTGLALVGATIFALSLVSAASAATAWTGSGTGSTSVVDDGSSGSPASFAYNVNPGSSGSWRFWTTGTADGVVELSYSYTGFHAFFQVRVSLTAFVTSGGITTNYPIVSDGPVNCCTAPSGGFAYTGLISLPVHAGDTFGFDMTGSHFDADARLLGTLTVTDVTPGPDRAGYCSVAGNSDPVTGAAIPVGTFLDLLSGQPSADPHYLGAAPAIFVEGRGITCDPPPSGFARSGFAAAAQHVAAGVYPYFRVP